MSFNLSFSIFMNVFSACAVYVTFSFFDMTFEVAEASQLMCYLWLATFLLAPVFARLAFLYSQGRVSPYTKSLGVFPTIVISHLIGLNFFLSAIKAMFSFTGVANGLLTDVVYAQRGFIIKKAPTIEAAIGLFQDRLAEFKYSLADATVKQYNILESGFKQLLTTDGGVSNLDALNAFIATSYSQLSGLEASTVVPKGFFASFWPSLTVFAQANPISFGLVTAALVVHFLFSAHGAWRMANACEQQANAAALNIDVVRQQLTDLVQQNPGLIGVMDKAIKVGDSSPLITPKQELDLLVPLLSALAARLEDVAASL